MSLFCETKTPIKFVLNLSMRLENDIRLTEYNLNSALILLRATRIIEIVHRVDILLFP